MGGQFSRREQGPSTFCLLGDVAVGQCPSGSGQGQWSWASPLGAHLLLRRLQLAPLGTEHLGDLGKGQIWVARANLLTPLVQEAHVAGDRCLGPIWQDLLPLLALGPAALLHRLQYRTAPLGGA